MHTPLLIAITPFESPDVKLLAQLQKTTAFPVLHAGRNRQAVESALSRLNQPDSQLFGLCLTIDSPLPPALPPQLSLLILPWGMSAPTAYEGEVLYQVHSIDEALEANAAKIKKIIAKGNESAGKAGNDSAFILLQRILQEAPEMEVWVQGGAGVHTTAGLLAIGAKGVVLDSQLALFPECNAPDPLKQICKKLNGSETRLIGGYRVLTRPNSPTLTGEAGWAELQPLLGTLDPVKAYIPMGQDIALSTALAQRYGKLAALFNAIQLAADGHLNQARAMNILGTGSSMAESLGTRYSIVQGPMTRVSDVPAFAAAVAEEGALPFIALSLMKGETARDLISKTKITTNGKPWGIGILGFAPPELREEQMHYIMEAAPPFVLIAGGRPAQAAALEQAGISSFLHVPTYSLLDLFLKEGAKKFVFEGRECGGHVGPLSSLVLWELQVSRLLLEEQAAGFHILFAGGIHDSLSAAFVSVMAAPLAVRGARIGVLMGTAYLYTREAVETGAIVQQFQDKALQSRETILLETAPGHETRCLSSPFGDFFNQEKIRLQKEKTDKKIIWEHLENLNVGRLRIASKGIDRKDGELITVSEQQQAEAGMYMIGQVASLQHKLIDMATLHQNVAEGSHACLRQLSSAQQPASVSREKALDIAIVGMACVYPEAHNVEEFWRNILQGKDCITEVPDERWNKSVYYDPEAIGGRKSPSKWGGFIPKVAFDPLSFGIPPQSLAAIDPAQLISLLVARQALEDAGYPDGANLAGEDISVIIGAEGGNDLSHHYGFRTLFPQLFGELPSELEQALPKLTEDSFPGILGNVIAGRITNRLNLGGRNYTVDAACASSLAALDLACQELILGKSDMVIAGAADLHNGINDYLMFASTHALSRKGRCATFDSEADGIALGEGVAMLVLKRKEDALRDGDKIYALVKGLGGSSDGKSLGLTAPRKSGQLKAMERAYRQAGISPASVKLIEAHGTGTVVGDKTELSALTDMWTETGALAGQTILGSVKTQIGHTKCAAGMAGIIKSALSVYHGVLPPTLHLRKPNPYYQPETSPFKFHHQASPWLEQERRAGISAFGFGGTNFHAVIENNTKEATEPILKTWPLELFIFRGDSWGETVSLIDKVGRLLRDGHGFSLKDLAYSLAFRNDKPIQLVILADTVDVLSERIGLAFAKKTDKAVFYLREETGKVVFLFPGQGSQRVGMAASLFTAFPAMRNLLMQYPEYAAILNPPAAFDENAIREQKETLKKTAVAQPLLGIADLAIANLLKDLGIQADILAGHSYGELPALCFAGVLEESQLVSLSEGRAAAILTAIKADRGMMVAVTADQEKIDEIIKSGKGIYAVNHNSLKQWVLAGSSAAMSEALEVLKSKEVPHKLLGVECAFHSPLLKGADKNYSRFLESFTLTKAKLPVWSNTLAKEYPESEKEIKQLLARHLVSPVRFTEEIQGIYKQGGRLFIEVGPGSVLTGLTKSILGDSVQAVHTEGRENETFSQLLTVLATYLCSGRSLNLHKLFEGRGVRMLEIDHPENYKKSPTLWWVNGQMALPDQGKLPSHGAMPITQPLAFQQSKNENIYPVDGPTENLVRMYLDSMRKLALAQRDVMLGFLGQESAGTPVPGDFDQNAYAEIDRPAIPSVDNTPALQPNLSEPGMQQDKNMKSLLLKIVSEKTGYPEDMLDPDLDLEADLSIDSIKRMEIIAELRELSGNFKPAGKDENAVTEALAGIKTLNALIQWFTQHTPDSQKAESHNVTNKERKPPSMNEADIRVQLMEVVSEKTGYPGEMLDPDMDMEADLSIDSIKRTEIMAEMKNRLGKALDKLVSDPDGNLAEQMVSIKTLNELTGWLFAKVSGEEAENRDLQEENTARTLTPIISRSRFELQAHFPDEQQPADLTTEQIAITAAGKYSTSLKSELEKAGAKVNVIGKEESATGCSGLIILDISGLEETPTLMESFGLLKDMQTPTTKWVLILSDSCTYCQKQGIKGHTDILKGYAGFIKSLDLEWDSVLCRLINIETDLNEIDAAVIVRNELAYSDSPNEVFYQNGIRHIKTSVPAELYTSNNNLSALDKDAVVLVTGGAQGITAELIQQLAFEYPCQYILLGRTALPEESSEDNSWRKLYSRETIRKALIASGRWSSPTLIEQKTNEVHKQNGVRKAIETLNATGARVNYCSIDLRSKESMAALLDELYDTYGRIDGVIHGAGILEDKLFRQKDAASFERVYTTKIAPLQVMAEKLRLKELKFMILFSSVASAFGNKGQTDYAAANSAMDAMALLLGKQYGINAVSVNWGPWQGAGMVSPTLEREYERRGIPLLPIEKGKRIFVDELKHGNASQVLIMAEVKSSQLIPQV